MSTPAARSDRDAVHTPMEHLEPRMLLSVSIEQTTLEVGPSPESVVVADFDGDGRTDIASANAGDSTLTVLLANGKGGFDSTTIEVGGSPDGLASLDVDEDGDPDLAVFDGKNGSFLLFDNQGDGTFAASEGIFAGDGARNALLGDFDGDGSADIAVAYADGSLTVFFPGVETPFEIDNPFDDPMAIFDGPFQKFFEKVVQEFTTPGGGDDGVGDGTDDGTGGGDAPIDQDGAQAFADAFAETFVSNGSIGVSQQGWDMFWGLFKQETFGAAQNGIVKADEFVHAFEDELEESFFNGDFGAMDDEITGFIDSFFGLEDSVLEDVMDQFETFFADELLGDFGIAEGAFHDFFGSFLDGLGDVASFDTSVPSEQELLAVFDSFGEEFADEFLDSLPGLLVDEFFDAYDALVDSFLSTIDLPSENSNEPDGGGNDGVSDGWDGNFEGFLPMLKGAFAAQYLGEGGVFQATQQEWNEFFAAFEASLDTSAFGLDDPAIFGFVEQLFQQQFIASFIEGDPDAPIDTGALDGFVEAFGGEFLGEGEFDVSEQQLLSVFDQALGAFLDSANSGSVGDGTLNPQGDGTTDGPAFFDPFFEIFSDLFANEFVPAAQQDGFFDEFDGWIDEAFNGAGFGGEDEFPGGGDLKDFVPHDTYDVGLSLLHLASEDFNGDGALDIAVADVKTGLVHVLINTGDGTFEAPVAFDVGAEPSWIVAGDVNGDERVDLLSASADHDKVAVLLNTGEALGEPQFIKVGNQPVFVGTVDFDGDGRLEIVTANAKDGTISVILQEQEGLVRVADLVAGDSVVSALGADLDGDGLPELITANAGAGTLTIFSFTFSDEPGEGDGLFTASPGAIDLVASSDTGASDTDDVTSLDNGPASRLSFNVTGVEAGAVVKVYADEVLVGQATVGAGASSVVVETNGTFVLTEGEHEFVATQTAGGVESAASGALIVTVALPKVESKPEPIAVKTNDQGETVIEVKGADEGSNVEINLTELGGEAEINGPVLAAQKKPNAKKQQDKDFVGAPTDTGFVVFQGEDGAWSARNLTQEIPNAEGFTGNVVKTFTTPWGLVNFVGFNEDGDLVFYWQNGKDATGESWNFINLYDKTLRVNDKATPEFVGDIAAWVTPWGALNIGGVDEDGNLVVLWWTPAGKSWNVTNLTQKLGGESLAGRLSAIAGLNSMRLSAVDTGGRLVEYVWERNGAGWVINDVTLDTSSPLVAPGSVETFRSENLSEDGFRRVFTGAISQTGDSVVIFSFDRAADEWSGTTVGMDATTPKILVGQVTGFTSEAGVDTLAVGASDGTLLTLTFDAAIEAWSVLDSVA